MACQNLIRKTWAFWKRDLLESQSYKAAYFFELCGIIANTLTFFFVAKLIPPQYNPFLAPYGGDYFSFVLIGLTLAGFQSSALHNFSGFISKEQDLGTFEALLMTPTSFKTLLFASTSSSFFWGVFRIVFYLGFASAFLAFDPQSINLFSTAVTLILTAASLLGLGMMSAAFTLVYKQGDPVQFVFNGLSRLFSGVYFPVVVLPFGLQGMSAFFPMTYGLEAMRKAILQGLSVMELQHELGSLLGFTVLLLPIGIASLKLALRQAKKEGSLAFR